MSTNYHKAKAAVICFCLFLTAGCLTAQNTGYYKYIINPDVSFNTDVLLVDNHYYVLSNGDDFIWAKYDYPPYKFHPTTTVTVFDESFNKIKQVQLLDNKSFDGVKFFYKDNHFYVFGYKYNLSIKRQKLCIAKFDKDFNLILPLSLYKWDDNFHYVWYDIIKTEKNEYMASIRKGDGEDFEGLLHISNEGDFLQESLTSFFNTARVVEADSHYFLTFFYVATTPAQRHGNILKFRKDSLEKYEIVSIKPHILEHEEPDGMALIIDKQFIYTNRYSEPNYECINNEYYRQDQQSVVFLDENMNLKNRLVTGKDCEYWYGGMMDYINSDSIYTIHRYTNNFNKDNTRQNFFISNFSKDRNLNFTVDVVIEDTLTSRWVSGCKALPNGGLIAYGSANYRSINDKTEKGTLLYYHPTKEVNINQLQITNYELRVYPNPTSNQLRITNYELRENTNIQIYDIVGCNVGTWCAASLQEEMTIDISHLASGLYFLKIDGKTIKVIKN